MLKSFGCRVQLILWILLAPGAAFAQDTSNEAGTEGAAAEAGAEGAAAAGNEGHTPLPGSGPAVASTCAPGHIGYPRGAFGCEYPEAICGQTFARDGFCCFIVEGDVWEAPKYKRMWRDQPDYDDDLVRAWSGGGDEYKGFACGSGHYTTMTAAICVIEDCEGLDPSDYFVDSSPDPDPYP